MARLLKGIPPEFEERGLYPYGDRRNASLKYVGWERQLQLENEAMALVEGRTTVVKQQVADSYAYYEVVKTKPLQIRWIPFMDEWTADPAWIRGLNTQDVIRQEQFYGGVTNGR